MFRVNERDQVDESFLYHSAQLILKALTVGERNCKHFRQTFFLEIIAFLQHPECANRIKHLSYGYQLDFHKFQTWSSDVGSGETKRLPDRFVPPFSSLWFQSWALFSQNWALEKNATKATAKPDVQRIMGRSTYYIITISLHL